MKIQLALYALFGTLLAYVKLDCKKFQQAKYQICLHAAVNYEGGVLSSGNHKDLIGLSLELDPCVSEEERDDLRSQIFKERYQFFESSEKYLAWVHNMYQKKGVYAQLQSDLTCNELSKASIFVGLTMVQEFAKRNTVGVDNNDLIVIGEGFKAALGSLFKPSCKNKLFTKADIYAEIEHIFSNPKDSPYRACMLFERFFPDNFPYDCCSFKGKHVPKHNLL